MISRTQPGRRARIRAALVALSSLAALISGSQQALAADPVPIKDEGKLFTQQSTTPFELHPREMPGVDDRETARSVIEGLEAKGVVEPVTPASVALEGLESGRPLCHSTGLNETFKYNGFCWSGADDATSAFSPGGGWHPQGFTASHDGETSGTVDGHHLYMASWYAGNQAEGQNKRARISILKSTGTEWKYGHVLLVRPTGSRANPGYTAVTDVHADAMVWYGDRLFVANGGELQIYDLDHLWLTIHDGFKYVLPMVARYANRDKITQDTAPVGSRSNMNCDVRTCLNALSLDRSVSPPQLVSGRYGKSDNPAPRDILRWSPASFVESGTSIVKPTAAFAAPVHQLQGVATDGKYYYMSAQCDTGYMGDSNTQDELSYSCIWQAPAGGGEVSILTRAPALTQNLSYSTQSGRLWGMNEQTNHRVVFSLLPREADDYRYIYNDYSLLCAGAASKIDNSTPVIQWGCNNAKDERWKLEDTGDGNGTVFLRNLYSGKCMGSASSTSNGAGMIQYTCNGAADEKWTYSEITRELRNVHSQKCLGLGAGATKGSQLIQWTCNGAQDERWTISTTAPSV
ncbi:RICIN domain-containing protein [Streptomyces pristinaespiralis]|uniref:RICIN domain-containing protein n=1 Tax=Streptomyces pristinaespiralis TaxID=38300 RepID=UPI0033E714CB